jgi:hypothetical protein
MRDQLERHAVDALGWLVALVAFYNVVRALFGPSGRQLGYVEGWRDAMNPRGGFSDRAKRDLGAVR